MLTNMFPPHSYGGYELWCRDVLRRWRRAGHDVAVLTSDVRVEGAGTGEEPGIEVRRVLRLYWEDHVVVDPPPWERLQRELANRRHLVSALRSQRPDVVSAWAMGAMSLGLLAVVHGRGLPVVSVVCDEWPVYGPTVDAWSRLVSHHRLVGAAVHLATGLPARLADLDAIGPACFVSEAVRDRARSESPWGFPDAVMVPSGVDRSEFPPRPDRDRPWRWRLLHVGRIDPRKGLDTVIEGLATCPGEATLEVLGDGDPAYLRQLGALAGRLGLEGRVTFGRCGRGELAARYAAADAVVFAPLWDEPFGLVPLEAMACGTPVVASPTGGSREFLVDGGNCLTFAAGDATGMVAALGRLAEDAGLRRALVATGLETVARYDTDRLAGELEEWHRRAAGGGRR